MIKNVIFDIGNVILNFDLSRILPEFTKDREEQEFIIKNILHSKEWLEEGLIDLGDVTREEAIKLVCDRTKHEKDELIENFWNHYCDYVFLDQRVIDVIKKLKENGYSIFLLSNFPEYLYQEIKTSELFSIVDGYILSHQVHRIKPYPEIYEQLVQQYQLVKSECFFLDDNEQNVKTAKRLGFYSEKVEPDSYDSIVKVLQKYKILEKDR